VCLDVLNVSLLNESLGVEQGVQTFKDKWMQTQYEMKFFQSVFVLKVEFSFSNLGYGSIYSLKMELKVRVRAFPAYGRLRIMDLVKWHRKLT
jgi:hypothetical protein